MSNPLPYDYFVLCTKAVEADNAKDYSIALVFYRQAIQILMDVMKDRKKRAYPGDEKREEEQQRMKAQVKKLMSRAEVLQKHLSSNPDKEKTSRQLATRKQPQPERKPDRRDDRPGQNQRAVDTRESRADNEGGRVETEESANANKEWSFHFDIKFDMKNNFNSQSPTSPKADLNEKRGSGLYQNITDFSNLARSLWR